MKSQITVVLVSLVSLWAAPNLQAQHGFPAGQYAYPPAAGGYPTAPAYQTGPTGQHPGYAMPVQHAAPMPPAYTAQMPMQQVPTQTVMQPTVMQPTVMQPTVAPAPVAPAPVASGPVGSGCDASCNGCDSCASSWCGACGQQGCYGSCGGFFGSLRHRFHASCNDLFNGCALLKHSVIYNDHRAPRPSWTWVDAEALYWWSKDRALPPLVTTSAPGTAIDEAGVLGLSDTQVLYGDTEVDDEPEWGGRINFGIWLDSHQTVGIGGRGFFLGPEETSFVANSNGNVILARPFFDEDLGIQDSLIIAFPGTASGTIDARTSNLLQGYELYLRKMLYTGYGNRVDFIGGFQGTRIDDSVRVSHVIVSEPPDGQVPIGTSITTNDIFRARSEFYGGEIGLMAQGCDGRLTWNLMSKVAFGNTRETVTIRGDTVVSVPGAGFSTNDFGLLALPSNIGVYEGDEFTIVPELAVNVSYSVKSWLQLSIGYSVIYWTNAVMAGDAIDLSINPTQIGGPLVGTVAPTYSLADQSFWAQGLTVGVNGRF